MSSPPGPIPLSLERCERIGRRLDDLEVLDVAARLVAGTLRTVTADTPTEPEPEPKPEPEPEPKPEPEPVLPEPEPRRRRRPRRTNKAQRRLPCPVCNRPLVDHSLTDRDCYERNYTR